MNFSRSLASAVALCLVAVAHATAQRDSADARLRTMLPAQPGARAIAGVVVDSTMTPIESVTVFLASLKEHTLTRRDGTFRLNDVKPGKYRVTARKIGFAPQVRDVTVGESGGLVGFQVVPIPYVLAPVISSSKAGGLSGIVGDTAYSVLAGAEVWLMTGGGRVTTDSSGAFFIDAKPGHYMLRISRPGFAPRLMSVTIPSDSGRHIIVWLAPAARAATARETALMDQLSERLLRRDPIWSKILTREDIMRSGIEELPQLAQMAAERPLNENCEAIVDGKERMPLWALDASEIETLEVYTHKPPRQTSNSSSRVYTQVQPADDCPATVFVWLRR